MTRPTRRDVLRAGMIGATGLAATPVAFPSTVPSVSARERFAFHHDHIFGTSLDLWFHTTDEQAAYAAENAILVEMERLRRIFSLFDSTSELSRLNRTSGPVRVSPDLLAVLKIYENWTARTDGANDPQVAAFVELWTAAARNGQTPTQDALAAIRQQVQFPPCAIDTVNSTATRNELPLNLNCVVKGYALEQIRKLVREQFPQITAGLLNLGGDMTAWGNEGIGQSGWLIGVQNPAEPADNAAPVTTLRLLNGSLASSGGYLRHFDVAGRQRSHIIDPRSGWPADKIVGATVVARDSITANILATTLCVLAPQDGVALVEQTTEAEGIVFPVAEPPVRTSGFAAHEQLALADTPAKPDDAAAKSADGWPEGFQAKVSLELPNPGGRARRPYVAVWIEDAKDKPVRTLIVWGNSSRWLPEMSGWWKIAKNDPALVRALTRATRGPGKYDVIWDGNDDYGKPLPQGEYTVKIEVHREHGRHLYQTGKLTCKGDDAKITLDKNAELEETTVVYAKKK